MEKEVKVKIKENLDTKNVEKEIYELKKQLHQNHQSKNHYYLLKIKKYQKIKNLKKLKNYQENYKKV